MSRQGGWIRVGGGVAVVWMMATGTSVHAVLYGTAADFDLTGSTQTPYSLGAYGYTPTVITGGPTGNYMRLASGAVGGTNPSIGFDQQAQLSDTMRFDKNPVTIIDFDFKMKPGAGRADGMGLALLRTADYGSTGTVPGISESPSFVSAHGANFGVGFDIYSNGEPDNNHITLNYGGEVAAAQTGSIGFDLANDRFHHAQVKIQYRADGSGADVTMTVQENSLGMNTTNSGTPVTLFNNVFIAGLTPYDYRVGAGGRTGGETADHEIDNISVASGASGFSFASDFRGRGSELALVGTARLQTDTALGYTERLRLTDNGFSEVGSAWDTTKQLVSYGFSTDFQFQSSLSQNGGADGLSFIVQNTTEGTSLSAAEFGPGYNALTIEFDSWQNDGEVSAAHLQVLAGGNVLATVNLNDGPWNIADLSDSGIHKVRIDYLPNDLDIYLDGVLAVDSLKVVLEDLLGGSAVDGYGKAWVGFGARTGGAAENHDVLNWQFVSFVPEPATVALLGLASLLGLRSRRRAS